MKTTKKKNFTRLFAFLMAFVMVTALAANAVFANGKTTFKDVDEEHWAYDYIEALVEADVIRGFGDGTFRPDEPITRRQAAQMIVRASTPNFIWPVDWDYKSKFSDIESTESNIYIMALEKRQVVGGFPDNTFRPLANITRAQSAKMISLAFGFNFYYGPYLGEFDYSFSFDADKWPPKIFNDQIVAQDQAYVNYLASFGIVRGYPQADGTVDFKPWANVTRAQFSKMIYMAMGGNWYDNWEKSDEVRDSICDLPDAKNIKLSNKKAVEKAREEYEKLTADQKALVNTSKLEAAEAAIAKIEKAIEDAVEELKAYLDPTKYTKNADEVADIIETWTTIIKAQPDVSNVEACLVTSKAELDKVLTDDEQTFVDAFDKLLSTAQINALDYTKGKDLADAKADIEAARVLYDAFDEDTQAKLLSKNPNYVNSLNSRANTVKARIASEAPTAVLHAETYPLQDTVVNAQLLVSALPADVAPATDKADLQKRIDDVQAIVDYKTAEAAVVKAELALNLTKDSSAGAKLDAENDYAAAKALVDALPLNADKVTLTNKLVLVRAHLDSIK